MGVYIGIDGGGTSTKLVAADENRKKLIRTEGGTINYCAVGMEKARGNLTELLNRVSQELGVAEFSNVYIGSSAFSEEPDRAVSEAFLRGVINARNVKMNSDVYIALAAVPGLSPKAIAISGTGSIAAAVRKDGKVITKGGWGHIIGDEGSAYKIAVNGLRAAVREYEHPMILSKMLCKQAVDFFSVKKLSDIVSLIYDESFSKDKLAAFAPIVYDCAENGDNLAKDVIISEARSFSETVLSLLDEVPQCCRLYLYGGVFMNNAMFSTFFSDFVLSEFPETEIGLLTTPPEDGALKLSYAL